MAFRYPLQSVLRLRRSLEQQAEQRLFVIAGQVLRLRAEIEEHNLGEMERKRAGLELMAAGSFGAILRYAVFCEAASEAKRVALQVQLAAAERQRLEQLSRYHEARQKREILESVRERQKLTYDLTNARRDQQSADETFLLRKFFNEQN
jgi:flagellar export protein FliJ